MSGQGGFGDDMTMTRLAAILDAYGAEPRRWPAQERRAAERLLDASAAARELWESARDLDHALAASRAPGPSPALRAAILAAAPAQRGVIEGPPVWQALIALLASGLGGARPAGAVLAVALLLGIAAGSIGGGTASAPPSADLMQLALFDDQLAAEY